MGLMQSVGATHGVSQLIRAGARPTGSRATQLVIAISDPEWRSYGTASPGSEEGSGRRAGTHNGYIRHGVARPAAQGTSSDDAIIQDLLPADGPPAAFPVDIGCSRVTPRLRRLRCGICRSSRGCHAGASSFIRRQGMRISDGCGGLGIKPGIRPDDLRRPVVRLRLLWEITDFFYQPLCQLSVAVKLRRGTLVRRANPKRTRAGLAASTVPRVSHQQAVSPLTAGGRR